ncbi:4Fe-4S binding protein [Sporolituus thermophilus]|uniref:MinD superfamily P-loop ATPase, contains an inserted ferredoxin domain n=1 Tax=Sporolituus thermophilus DSM 23256 TaxID=1123285 RepID=A0A1G7NWM1_9FIRM|nr:ATP-binding protein [Sporolituus thermophilus]SDF78373.1 MinD superfamily P-loop ATPase, contains an inserted ferredoxin domain [Sporolituus thermophilus DSM 23256]
MIISIASGKGGTGKTSLALLLASVRPGVTVADCDVEEPNCHLLLSPAWQDNDTNISVMTPVLDVGRCTGCGRCSEVCLFNAIAIAGGKAVIFDELCHSCGGCLLACPTSALTEGTKTIGVINSGMASVFPGVQLVSGHLRVGAPSATPLIKAVKKALAAQAGDIIVDCPPGTACAMVAAVAGSDVCLLVTEPTPFGRHDLELAIGIVRLLNLPAGVIINKSDPTADHIIEDLCREHALPVIAKLPYSPDFARHYAAGRISQEFAAIASQIWDWLAAAKEASACKNLSS